MALTVAERRKIVRQFVTEAFVRPNSVADQATDAIDAAAVALEAYLASVAADMNAALPQPFRGAATVERKRLLAALVFNVMAGSPLQLGGD